MGKLLFSLLFFNSFLLFSQTPTIQWQRALGGTYDETASSIQQTSDGGYIVFGSTKSNNWDVSGNHSNANSDYWVVKLNNVGTIQWQKCYGGAAEEIATFAQQTSDGGYIVAGYSSYPGGDVTVNFGGYDYWMVKLDVGGNIQWQKSLGGTGHDLAKSIHQTLDGGYILAGISNASSIGNIMTGNYWIVKLDNSGVIQWQNTLALSSGLNEYCSIQQTTDGGYVFTGGFFDYTIIKFNNLGSVQWQKSYGGAGGNQGATCIQQTTDGGYIVAGYSDSNNDGDVTGNHGSNDYWVIKLDNLGNLQWQKSLGGTDSDKAYSIQQTTDGGYIVAGTSYSINGDIASHIGTSGNADCWIVKLTSIGTIEWQKSLGGTRDDYAYSIKQTIDGGYVFAGSTKSHDVDVSGNSWWTSNAFYPLDYWVVKLNASSVGINANINLANPSSVYPNPNNGQFTITSEAIPENTTAIIYNALGEEVYQKKIVQPSEMINTNLGYGIYLLKVLSDKEVTIQKIIIDK